MSALTLPELTEAFRELNEDVTSLETRVENAKLDELIAKMTELAPKVDELVAKVNKLDQTGAGLAQLNAARRRCEELHAFLATTHETMKAQSELMAQLLKQQGETTTKPSDSEVTPPVAVSSPPAPAQPATPPAPPMSMRERLRQGK